MGRPPLPVGTYGQITAKRDGSRWKAWCKYRDTDGHVRKVRCWADTKAKAESKLRERLVDRQSVSGQIKVNTKVVVVAERWLAEFRDQVELGNRSGTSLDTYEHRWRTLVKPRVEGLSIGELSAGQIDRVLQGLNKEYSASTAKTARAIISGLCGLAVRHGALKTNPVRDARPVENGKRRRQSRALTADEVLDIFVKVDGDETARRQDLPDIMRFYGGTGERTGEAIAVRWEDIDFDEKVAWVEGNMVRTKADGAKINGGKTRTARRGVALADWLVTMLLDRRARVAAESGVEPQELTGWVFPNSIGGLRETSNLRRDWRAFRERHGIGDWFTPRTFRRTVATLVTDALPAREASDLLGHSRVSQTTDTYVGRGSVSRRPAVVLGVLGRSNGGTKGAPRSTDDTV
ncbi:tyrosine-type recombinase/integrase [Amycolatopsis sp. K13G38]|uniref:Tyrosine-type recombinase/integrase n=1 Tax=Amycolatopsis acididurans TaxID=2724524 RepID=A0ABX1J6I5_9PSEU|nr:tyrosine-type recombinase/integrase [Amycolatopsis acididurans]NKQ55428.1 tyrosine-type recombinase/integrase [Amycolatopsis acididurans]